MQVERLSRSAEQTIEKAVIAASGQGRRVGVGHLVAALKDDGFGRFLNLRDDADALMLEEPESEDVYLSEQLTEVLDYAERFSIGANEPFVTTEHLAIALAKCRDAQEEQAFEAVAEKRSFYRVGPPPPPKNPLDEISRASLLDMEVEIHKTIVGQKKAVKVISETVRRAAAGLADANRPFGSFLFLGPTGVGKTELSKSLSGFLYGSVHSMVRIDMSEYREQHSMARLIGSPPGYIGHTDGGQLTNAIQKNPYSLVLFDEMEKAHPDVLNILLQVFDDGRLTDGMGNTVDMTGCVMVMTSNVGSQVFQTHATASERKDLVLAELWRQFRPEFLNRIDEIVVFDSLEKDDFYEIIEIQLNPVVDMMKRRGVDLVITHEAKAFLVEGGWNPVLGARQLRRFIQRKLQNPLADKVLAADFKGRTICKVTAATEELEFEVTKA